MREDCPAPMLTPRVLRASAPVQPWTPRELVKAKGATILKGYLQKKGWCSIFQVYDKAGKDKQDWQRKLITDAHPASTCSASPSPSNRAPPVAAGVAIKENSVNSIRLRPG